MKGLIETSFYKHREISTTITVLSVFVFRTRRVIGRANQIVTCKMYVFEYYEFCGVGLG